MRILVVDDSAPVRARLCEMLGDLGTPAASIEVDEALDGASALLLFGRHRYQVLILDLHLPGMSGLDVLTAIRERAVTVDRVVVVVSTNGATAHHRRACLAAGADYFFDKSSEFSRVCDVVQELVRTIGRAPATVESHLGAAPRGHGSGDGPT